MAGCIATLRAGVERKTENRIGSTTASAWPCPDDDDDSGDDDDDYYHYYYYYYDNEDAHGGKALSW